MAWAIRSFISKLQTSTRLYKITSMNHGAKIQVAWISTREVRQTRPRRPEPFPYKEKKFGVWKQLFDDTIFRFDDNTKVIVVEGPPAMGKSELCKKLAYELDMLYVPQVTLADYYLHRFDFDLRTLNDKLPESCQEIDFETFLKNPTQRNGGDIQFLFYQLRFQKYIQLLAHLLSTGQGIVTVRSPWSDMCFANAMHSNGYISSNAFKSYNIMIDQSRHELMKPHLIIYLDAPVTDVLEKLKKRNNPEEVNSKVLNEKFLTDLENNYKYDFLKKMSKHAHILMYDYSRGGDFEVIVEDIETLKFEEADEKHFSDWYFMTIHQWTNVRRSYNECEDQLLGFLRIDQMIAEELIVSSSDMLIRDNVLKEFAPRQVWDSAYVPLQKEIFEKKLLEVHE